MAHDVAIGTEVAVTVPGRDDTENQVHNIALAPGASPETVFEALNHSLGTHFTSDHFVLSASLPGEQGQHTFAPGENVTEKVHHGTHLSVVPRSELSLGM